MKRTMRFSGLIIQLIAFIYMIICIILNKEVSDLVMYLFVIGFIIELISAIIDSKR